MHYIQKISSYTHFSAFVALILFPFIVNAQKNEGQIDYIETLKLNIQLGDGPEAEEIRKMMPSERSVAKTLYFNANEGLFKNAAVQKEGNGDLELNSQSEEGDVQIRFNVAAPENRIYRNLSEGKVLESQEFFGRQFLIGEEHKKMQWKIGAEQKQILGYLCQKATLQDTSRKVEAWFTPSIPVALGPAEFQGLPGMILEINANNGDRKIVADKVELKKLEDKTIEKPTKGKEVSREEFKKIRDEKLKEMGAEPGGNGTMRVIIRN